MTYESAVYAYLAQNVYILEHFNINKLQTTNIPVELGGMHTVWNMDFRRSNKLTMVPKFSMQKLLHQWCFLSMKISCRAFKLRANYPRKCKLLSDNEKKDKLHFETYYPKSVQDPLQSNISVYMKQNKVLIYLVHNPWDTRQFQLKFQFIKIRISTVFLR
jgi:hypothetical protein